MKNNVKIGMHALLVAGIAGGQLCGMQSWKRTFKSPRRTSVRASRSTRRFTAQDHNNIKLEELVKEYVAKTKYIKDIKANDPVLDLYIALEKQITCAENLERQKLRWTPYVSPHQDKASMSISEKYVVERRGARALWSEYKDRVYKPIENDLRQLEERGSKVDLFKKRGPWEFDAYQYRPDSEHVPTEKFYTILEKTDLTEKWLHDE